MPGQFSADDPNISRPRSAPRPIDRRNDPNTFGPHGYGRPDTADPGLLGRPNEVGGRPGLAERLADRYGGSPEQPGGNPNRRIALEGLSPTRLTDYGNGAGSPSRDPRLTSPAGLGGASRAPLSRTLSPQSTESRGLSPQQNHYGAPLNPRRLEAMGYVRAGENNDSPGQDTQLQHRAYDLGNQIGLNGQLTSRTNQDENFADQGLGYSKYGVPQGLGLSGRGKRQPVIIRGGANGRGPLQENNPNMYSPSAYSPYQDDPSTGANYSLSGQKNYPGLEQMRNDVPSMRGGVGGGFNPNYSPSYGQY